MRRLLQYSTRLLWLLPWSALVLFGCSSEDPASAVAADGWSNPIAVEIDFPVEWVVQRGSGLIRLIGIAPLEGANDDFAENVNVIVEPIPEGVTWSGYLDARQRTLLLSLDRYDVLDSDKFELFGFPTVRHLFDYESSDQNLRSLQYLIKVGSEVCVVTCVAEEETYELYVDQFESIVASLRVE